MKRFLQLCSTVAAVVLMSSVMTAQRQIPLSVTVISPAQGAVVENGAQLPLAFSITNESPSLTLLASDTLGFHIDGIHEEGEYVAIKLDQFPQMVPNGLAPGQSLTIIFAIAPNNTTGPDIEDTFCVNVVGIGQLTPTGSWVNSNNLEMNDIVCTEFILKGDQPVSVTEEGFASSWSVYPNPANEQISIAAERLSADAEIMIYNNMGQRVYVEKTSAYRNAGAIQTSEWSNGIYMVTITQNGASKTERVLVQH